MNNIRELRIAKGISQTDLYVLVKQIYPAADAPLIGLLERVDIYPGDRLKKALCEALNCAEDEMIIDPTVTSEEQSAHAEKVKQRDAKRKAEEKKRRKDWLESHNADKDEYCVYMHIVPNGKVYVGKAKSARVLERWDDGMGYFGQKKVFRPIIKYGWDNIKHIILKDGLTDEEATEQEQRLIADLHSVTDGYNTRFR